MVAPVVAVRTESSNGPIRDWDLWEKKQKLFPQNLADFDAVLGGLDERDAQNAQKRR